MTIKEMAQLMSKQDIVNHYRNNYSLSSEEYTEIENMGIADLRNFFVEGESF